MSPGDKALWWVEQGAVQARLIGRVGVKIGIEIIDNEGLSALLTTQMPFSPAPRKFRKGVSSEYKWEKEES